MELKQNLFIYFIHDHKLKPFIVIINGNSVIIKKKNNEEYHEFCEFCKTQMKLVEKQTTFKCYNCGHMIFTLFLNNNRNIEYENEISSENILDLYSIVVWKHENVKNIFIGCDRCDKKRTKGNNILLELNDLEYIWIGSSIFQFKAKSQIIGFYSPIGNEDISYSYAIDENYRIYNESGIIQCTKDEIEKFDDYSISQIPFYLEIEKRENITIENFDHDIISDSYFIKTISNIIKPNEFYKQINFSLNINGTIYDKCCDFVEIFEKKANLSKIGHPIFLDKIIENFDKIYISLKEFGIKNNTF
jgi:hypothetical protein